MAYFRTYDRLIFAAIEGTEGTSVTAGVGDYIETIEPTFNITNRVYDRNVTRSSISPLLKTTTGSGAGAGDPSAMCEFTFGVELAGTGQFDSSTATWATEPKWSRLLTACGFEKVEVWRALIEPVLTVPDADEGLFDATVGHRTPVMMRNRSVISEEGGAGTAFAIGNSVGRLVGDLHFDDPYAYATPAGEAMAAGANGDRYFSQASGDIDLCNPYFTADASAGTFIKRGYGYSLISNSQLGGSGAANTSSLSISLQLGVTGQFIKAVGCRGNVEFVFTSGDRCVMQFTFQGKLHQYSDTTVTAVPNMVTQAVPPSVVGISAAFNDSGFGSGAGTKDLTNAIFNDFSLNIGNELALREDMNTSTGYEACYITGRTGSMTIGPDATPADPGGSGTDTEVAWWSRLLSGDPERMRLDLGADAGGDANSFTFKMPALQFEQVGDGERENIMTYDITGSMTSGDNGSTVQEGPAEAGGTPGTDITSSVRNTRLGTNNEFTLIYT